MINKHAFSVSPDDSDAERRRPGLHTAMAATGVRVLQRATQCATQPSKQAPGFFLGYYAMANEPLL